MPALVAVAVVAMALVGNGGSDPAAYAAISIAIWAAVLAGLVGRSLPAGRVGAPAVAAGVCLAGVVVLAGASIGWASDQGRAFDEAVRASGYLGLFALAACTATEGSRKRWIPGLTVGLAVVAALALVSRLQPGPFPEPEHSVLIPSSTGRLSYPIGYWNALAALLAVAMVLLASAGVRAPHRYLRAAAVGALPIPMLGIHFTQSRGGLIVAAVGLAVLVAASPRRGRQLVALAIGLAGGAVAVAVASGMPGLNSGFTFLPEARREGDELTAITIAVMLATGFAAMGAERLTVRPSLARSMRWPLAVAAALALVAGAVALDPGERFEEFKQPPPSFAARGFDPVGAEGSGRWQLWGESIEAFETAPLVGLGSGGFEEWWAQHATIDLFVRDAHSLFVQQLAELGLAGILLVAGFGAAIAVAARRRLAPGRDGDAGVLIAVVAAGAVAAGIDWSWVYPAALGPVVVAAGLLAASAPDRGPPGDHFALGLGAVTIAWVAIVAAALVVLTELKLEQSRSAAEGGRIGEAIDSAREARTVQPWSPQPYVQIALLEELGGDFEAALDRLAEAERRDSDDWRLALIEARLHARTGDLTARRIALRRARTLSPRFSGAGEGRETR